MQLYPVNIVGESYYQQAIHGCSAGERVFICHEQDNPYDVHALRVETGRGDVIGYIPKTNWLRDAIHEQGCGATATILSIMGEPGQDLGVVLTVLLTDDDIPTRNFGEVVTRAVSVQMVAEKKQGLFRRLFR